MHFDKFFRGDLLTVHERIKELAKERDITLAVLCRKIGVSRTYFSEASARDRSFSADRLKQIADALNTTAEYLLGETDQKEKPADVVSELSERDREILDLMLSLSEENFEKAYSYLEYLANQSKKK